MNLKTLKSVVSSQTNASTRWTLSSVGAKAVNSKSTSKTRTKNITRAGAVPPKCATAVNKSHIKGSHASRTKNGNFKILASFFALSVKLRLCATWAEITWRVQSVVMSSAGFEKKYAGADAEHFQYDNILGCGVSMMDKQHRSWHDHYGKRILIIFAFFFLWPVFIVFYIPFSWALKAYR